ncbi:16S rRNA (cytosine(1402)-N(4))-methyltransferase [Candidatus Phytoplasma phoenicium]|uniref:Ribosomal RNA small subunit methyltransferase H n=1 Tax=Candidatus Phytoplasma phoenicium TaxID=198422 RepID=A0A2S8NV74_9MOLU|nr:16S rRNA (cytosine(1402)-N(4))-methyltransferase [Candidatus Phytoplasma phoenicium]
MHLKHIPVLTKEIIHFLNIKPQGCYVDATLGGGGHSEEILKYLTQGFLYAFDQDPFAINFCADKFQHCKNITLINSNFAALEEELLIKRKIQGIDGILFDLGLSSFQIDEPQRGFSYLKDAALDMRMNPSQKLTAQEILNTYSFENLTKIFWLYGNEPKARIIAQAIIKSRPLKTTLELVSLIDCCYPFYISRRKGHSSKRIFQALRIEVNQELSCLEKGLRQSLKLLNKNGRIVVISFNSLEDRLVKNFFKKNSQYLFPPKVPFTEKELPQNILTIINKKVVLPTKKELKLNIRSHSAKLRAVLKNF